VHRFLAGAHGATSRAFKSGAKISTQNARPIRWAAACERLKISTRWTRI
jgi:hypothetical protein